MNWDAIGVITEIIGTIVVIITLVYLSKQVKDGNKQAELEGMRHTLDGFNQYCQLIVSDKTVAELMIKGRADFHELDEAEQMQFDHMHIHFLNTMEGWARSIEETAREESYKNIQEQNLEETVYYWFTDPGSRAVWDRYRAAFPLLHETFDRALTKIDQQN